MIEHEIPPKVFIDFFKMNTRVMFNWERLLREKWPIKMLVLKNQRIFKFFYTPWYINDREREVSYKARGATPLALSDIPKYFANLSELRQREIRSLSEDFVKYRSPVQFVIPVYALGRDKYLILDGTHRLAALVLSKVGFRILAFAVHGPVDTEILPDLRHWEASRPV